MTLHDQYQDHQRRFFTAVENDHAAQLAVRQQQLDTLTRHLADRQDTIDHLGERINTLVDQRTALTAEVARLTALLDPWEQIYTTRFATNDGWQPRNERQNNDASRNVPANAIFGPDGLTIIGKRERTGTGDTLREYTTADITGQHAAVPNYFRARVVGRAPHGKGLWPCLLWFRPANGSDGEIDLMENFGGQPRVKATLHSTYATRKMIGRSLPWAEVGDPAGVHEYVLEKTPGRILITVDGKTLMDVGPATPGTDVAAFPWAEMFENPARTWYPRITLQIGCGVDNPGCATGFPPADFARTEMRVTELELWSWKGVQS